MTTHPPTRPLPPSVSLADADTTVLPAAVGRPRRQVVVRAVCWAAVAVIVGTVAAGVLLVVGGVVVVAAAAVAGWVPPPVVAAALLAVAGGLVARGLERP